MGEDMAESSGPSLQASQSRPQSGRIHDHLIGTGKDTYPHDADVGELLLANARAIQTAARASRGFLLRAIHHVVAECGVRQIVELGSGYPCSPNPHEVAEAAAEGVRTLYLDNDPIVAAHGRALLADFVHSSFVQADITDVDAVLGEFRKRMAVDVPVLLCLSFVAEFVDDPRGIIDALSAETAAGSYLALSHITADIEPAVVHRAADIFHNAGIRFRPRSRAEVTSILAGARLVDPGLVAPHRWRPDIDHLPGLALWAVPMATEICCYAAVGQIR
ncbi:SAM-dependent methyltransferase [Nocardia suismassiliense]|uniref:SAM-dependent methyltransferase n=1 Tax=Nocardia suismassiliense TaxID=2077092 RepID=UPI002D78FEF6|nr:SAM-dependent methyltransferase [Nocardia suismassiliense]